MVIFLIFSKLVRLLVVVVFVTELVLFYLWYFVVQIGPYFV